MKAKPVKIIDGQYQQCLPEEATHIILKLAAPPQVRDRILPVQISGTRANTGNWTWNGDTEKPTLMPSVLTNWEGHKIIRCHTWIKDGQAQYLSDTMHKYSGQTIDLFDIE
jgi:Family of unknown function (DUF6527)